MQRPNLPGIVVQRLIVMEIDLQSRRTGACKDLGAVGGDTFNLAKVIYGDIIANLRTYYGR